MEELKKQLDRIEKLSLLAAKNVFTVEDLSLITGFSASWIYKLTSQKKIPHYKRSGDLYFDRLEIENWLKEVKVSTAEEINTKASKYIARNTGAHGFKKGGVR